MSSSGLSQRLAKFKQNFSQILGPKRHGYNEVGLEQPLVGTHTLSDDDYFQQHGVSRPGGQGRPAAQVQYHGPQDHSFAGSAGAPQPYTGASSAAIPDEADELRALAGLAREAAEILFEMAALQDESEAAHDMLEKSQQLQAQLRGMIGDFKGGDETALAQALEAFDILANTTDEYHAKGTHPPAASGGGVVTAPPAGASAVPALRPPATSNPFQANPFGGASKTPVVTAPGQAPKADEEPPLISFD